MKSKENKSKRKSSLSRSIDPEIKRALRREVNYGCPVPKCGNPYLTYHHFDPTYEEACKRGDTEHNVQGIVALCLAHHKKADIGTFTHEQLRMFKAKPFLSVTGVGGTIDWMRHEIIFRYGGLVAVRPQVIVAIDGKPVIWVRRAEDNTMLLNMDIRAIDGSSLMRIVDNDWDVRGSISDLEAVPSGRSLLISAPKAGVELVLEFHDLTEEVFKAEIKDKNLRGYEITSKIYSSLPSNLREYISSNTSLNKMFSEELVDINNIGLSWPALLVKLQGKFLYPREIILREHQSSISNLSMQNSMSVNIEVALDL